MSSSDAAATAVIPYDESVNEFKKYVAAWIELDNIISRMTQTLKEKRDLKQKVSKKIMGFMKINNVEDVNTKDMKLRYKVVTAKAPLSRKEIKERLMSQYKNDEAAGKKITDAVFEQKATVEKPTLRRLRIQRKVIDVEQPTA